MVAARPLAEVIDYIFVVIGKDAKRIADDLAAHMEAEADFQKRATLSRLRTVLLDLAVSVGHVEASMGSTSK